MLIVMPFADVNGIHTFYMNYGNDKDRYVLFLHGLGSSSITWRDISEALSRHFNTITVVLVGFGLSDKPTRPNTYTMNGFADFVVDFVETIGIREGPTETK